MKNRRNKASHAILGKAVRSESVAQPWLTARGRDDEATLEPFEDEQDATCEKVME